MKADISEAKVVLPLPTLMHRLGLGDHAKKSGRCPFHDDRRNSFSAWRNDAGVWLWKCHAGCGSGDEITLLEKLDGISNKQAINLFLEMAGVGQAIRGQSSARKISNRKPKPIDWQAHVALFTEKHLEGLSKWRGYSDAFCSWLHKHGLVGLWLGCIAFPVHDRADAVIGAHCQILGGKKWFYEPKGKGIKVRPLVIGKLSGAACFHVFESQWDAFAVCDKLALHETDDAAIIVTRGAENGALVAGLIPAGATVYAWKQNDEIKNGKRAGDEWLKAVCNNVGAPVKLVATPPQFKDANEWTQAGATAEELLKAINGAAPIPTVKTTDVELTSVLDSICDFLKRYIRFSSPAQPTAIALWIAHTWVLDTFDYTPYLHIWSPEKRCGKTRLLDCLELLVAKPWRAISPSEAVLYRKIECDRPTLLLDEVDTVFFGNKDERKEPLRALLNAGFEHKAKVPRCVGQGSNYHVQEFAVFCAKAFAGIGRLPDTINDRCIPIRLIRRSRDESVQRFRKRDAEIAIAPIRATLESCSQQNGLIENLGASPPKIPNELDDRQADICEPLLAIADAAGGDWPQRCQESLIALCASEAEDESLGIKLLSAIREAFLSEEADRLSTQQLLQLLVAQESDAPWANWWEHDLKNENTRGPAAKLARLLKPFGIHARGIRLADDTTPRGYLRQDFEEAWKRYCPA